MLRTFFATLALVVMAAGTHAADSFVFGSSQARTPTRLIAGSSSVTALDRGSYRNDGTHTVGNLNYLAGTCFDGCQGNPFDQFRNFFVFYIANFTGPVASAALEISAAFVVGSNHYELYDFTGDVFSLQSGVNGDPSFRRAAAMQRIIDAAVVSAETETTVRLAEPPVGSPVASVAA